MKFKQAIPSGSRWKEIRNFIIHLRWHYQLFILSGGYLLGGFLSAGMDWQSFLIQFANVHLLLFGGATAYNSYCDKDEGPVGGLKHPPKMAPWMRPASLIFQTAGLWLAVSSGIFFAAVYLMSMVLFLLYSTPLYRWKASPWKSLFAIGLSTGVNSVLLGFLAAGNTSINVLVGLAAIGVMLLILSLYPVSQLYQIDEDTKRGDQTFGSVYGKARVIRFFVVTFSLGVVLTSVVLGTYQFWLGCVFMSIGMITGMTVWQMLKSLTFSQHDYKKIMQIKYGTSLSFICFLVVLLFTKHAPV